jgi:AcrR family transcriptional regulator
MSPRKYQLGKRAAAVAETRARIVAAARTLFAEDGFHGAAVDAVAQRADVSRATVYYQFGSKLGLVQAVLDDIERSGRQEQVVAAVAVPDALEAIRGAFHEGCRFWAAEQLLIRKLTGLAAADADTRRLIDERDQSRLVLIRRLAQSLAEQGRLREDCSVDAAVQTLQLLSSFEVFDQLHTGQGLDTSAIAARLFTIAQRALLASPP